MRNLGTSSSVGARRAVRQRLAGLALGLGVLCAIALTQGVWAASPSDDTIVVRGNRRVEAAVVRGYFHAKPDGALDEAAVNDGLKALYASGLFADVKVAWSGTHLVVTVTEAPVIDRVQFEGNKQFKDKELTSEIRSQGQDAADHGRRPGRRRADRRALSAHRALRRDDHAEDHRQGRGPRRSRVRDQGRAEDRHRQDRVHRQPRLFRSAAQGRDQDERVGLARVPQDHRCLRRRPPRTDRDLLHAFYLKHGYADAQVVAATGAYDAARKGFEIAFTIEEGDRTGSARSTSHRTSARSTSRRCARR